MSWCSDAPEDEAISLFAGLLANPDVRLSLVLHDFGLHHLNIRTNLRVLIQLEYLQPIDVRHLDLVAQDRQRVENTHCRHSRQLKPFLAFHCLFPVIDCRSNNGVNVYLDHLCV